MSIPNRLHSIGKCRDSNRNHQQTLQRPAYESNKLLYNNRRLLNKSNFRIFYIRNPIGYPKHPIYANECTQFTECKKWYNRNLKYIVKQPNINNREITLIDKHPIFKFSEILFWGHCYIRQSNNVKLLPIVKDKNTEFWNFLRNSFLGPFGGK